VAELAAVALRWGTTTGATHSTADSDVGLLLGQRDAFCRSCSLYERGVLVVSGPPGRTPSIDGCGTHGTIKPASASGDAVARLDFWGDYPTTGIGALTGLGPTPERQGLV
jgi:hypothetical protein